MTEAYNYNQKDMGVLFIPPLSPVDIRVPTAEELTLNSLISVKERKTGLSTVFLWQEYPKINYNKDIDQLNFQGVAISSYQDQRTYSFNFAFNLPSLLFAEEERKEQLYLVSILVEEGEVHDPVLGTVSFQYDTPNGEIVTTPTRENTRRLREKFLLLLIKDGRSREQFFNSMNQDPDGSVYFEVNDFRGTLGIEYSPNLFVYDVQSTWISGIRYKLPLKAEGITFYPVAEFIRYKNKVVNGYFWKENELLDLNVNVGLSSIVESKNIKSLAYRLMQGLPLKNGREKLEVGNLSTGKAPVTYHQPGFGIVSPNGNFALANDQRISFTNEKRLHRQTVRRVVALSDADSTLLTTTLNTNSPENTVFGDSPTDHRIYSLNGIEQSDRGRFVGLDSNSTLLWYGGGRSTIIPGETAFFVPGIYYGGGSGFSEPLLEIVEAYIQNEPIDSSNIRLGYLNDLSEYEEPEGNPNAPFFVVYGPERNAIHYILKKITITANELGHLVIPEDTRGNIAFVKGRGARFDRPVVTGFNPGQNYDCLTYYPPRSFELWQFKYRSIYYQGKGTDYLSFLLDEVEIEENPFLFVHGNGSGNGVFKGEPMVRYKPIASFLPKLTNGTPIYELSGPIYYRGESATASLSNMRELQIKSTSEFVTPRKGMRIKFVPDGINNHQEKSLAGKLIDGWGRTLGFHTPEHATNLNYQYCLFLLVKKGDVKKMLVCTHIANRQKAIALDYNHQTAIDVFEV